MELRREDENCRQIIKNSSCLHRKTQTLHCFAKRNLNTFIASIYMKSRKVLKERMRIVCCLCYGKGEYPAGGGHVESGSHH